MEQHDRYPVLMAMSTPHRKGGVEHRYIYMNFAWSSSIGRQHTRSLCRMLLIRPSHGACSWAVFDRAGAVGPVTNEDIEGSLMMFVLRLSCPAALLPRHGPRPPRQVLLA